MKKEDIEFLKDLQHELNTQTNDGNASPVYWGVLETKTVGVPEGCGDDEMVVCDDRTYTCDEFVEHVDEYVDGQEEGIAWCDVDKSDIESVIDFYNDMCGVDEARLISTRQEDFISMNTGAFLTKRACKEYIERFGYNHSNPRTYAMTAYRNFELERLLHIISELDFSKITEDNDA